MEVYPPPMPYQICKIEELRKVGFYREVMNDLAIRLIVSSDRCHVCI